MRKTSLVAPATLAIALALAGCATQKAPPPHPLAPMSAGRGYGYSEARTAPGNWRITYRSWLRAVPPDAPRRKPVLETVAAQASDMALWRAAQIARRAGRRGFIVVNRRTDTNVSVTPGRIAYPYFPYYPAYSYGPYYRRHGYDPFWPLFAPSIDYDPPSARARATVVLTVRLTNRPGAHGHDARATIRRLQDLYGPVGGR